MVTDIQRIQPGKEMLEAALDASCRTAGAITPVHTRIRSFRGRLLKRCMDIGLSLPVVVFVLPPVAMIAWLSQRLQSPGPLLFKQERCGIEKKKFTILKFRTMNHVDDTLAGNPEARIFPIGNLLRKTKLDEVPQFINVLAGSMSIVGPRPHHFQDCVNFENKFKDYASRTIAKPGITGLAQYKEYRGDFEWNCVESRVKRDLSYIQEWSLLLDVKLIFKTANVILRKSRRGIAARVGYELQNLPVRLSVFNENKTVVDQNPGLNEVEDTDERKAA